MAVITRFCDGDVTTDWDLAVPGATHWDATDDAVLSPKDGELIRTKTANDVDESTVADMPGGAGSTSEISVKFRGQINDPSTTAKIRLELFHTSGTPVSGNPKDVTGADLGGYSKLGTVTKTWSSLSLTEAQMNTLQLKRTLLAS